MTEREALSTVRALKLALEALEDYKYAEARTIIREALAQPEQPKYRRGNRLVCLETDEYCVIHISGTDRQWVKFPDSYIGVYTNEQVAELFELLPKEPEQEPVATDWERIARVQDAKLRAMCNEAGGFEKLCEVMDKYERTTTPPVAEPHKRPSRSDIKPLTDEEIASIYMNHTDRPMHAQWNFARAIEAKLKEKNT